MTLDSIATLLSLGTNGNRPLDSRLI